MNGESLFNFFRGYLTTLEEIVPLAIELSFLTVEAGTAGRLNS